MSDYTFVAEQCHIKIVDWLNTILCSNKPSAMAVEKQGMHKSVSAGKLRLISSLT